jgi:crossover junction endodeoxyribonuclease RuvC
MIRPLRMVALDLSTAATAIAATHDPRGEPFLSTFTIPGTGGRPLHEQIAAISHVVRRSCGWAPHGTVWQPDLAVIEGTFTRMNGSDYPLHALHSYIKQWLWQRSIPYVDVAPTTLKVWATGNGNALKPQVIAAMIATYGHLVSIDPKDDNQADALALLTMGMFKYGQPIADAPLAHRRALKPVVWPALNLEGVTPA